MKNLVIVESPTKAKTLARFLGKEFAVESSYGHIRDLPKSKMGVDVTKNFTPTYVIPTSSRKVVTALKKKATKADRVYFATDEDREGEAIAWHLKEILETPEEKAKRITFHEITKEAILESLERPRAIDQHLVDAQQARRILDRLVGYELSPFLWRKVAKGLSAGRVQSVALRLIVEREREIEAFKPQEYWTIEGEFSKKDNAGTLKAQLSKVDGTSLEKFALKASAAAHTIVERLKGRQFVVGDVSRKEIHKSPPPPFTTSTLQQDANRRFGYSARHTMVIAQQLYEGITLGDEGSAGLVTYMRTDSVNLADKFLNEAHTILSKLFGAQYALPAPRRYKTKSKLAQEAHEAIRPTEVARTPDSVRPYLDERQAKLYELVWKRALATQMPESVLEQTGVDIGADGADGKRYTFRASGTTIRFDGYLRLFPDTTKESLLPPLTRGEELTARSIEAKQHFTEPPARFSEAGIVKTLEEYGIGRPSTYAPTIATIIERRYVEREERRLKPTEMGLLVTGVLTKHFPNIVDYQFTAKMEDGLDTVALGQTDWVKLIKEFYVPFKAHLATKEQEVQKKDLTEEKSDVTCDVCGRPMVVKMGRFGKFLACTGFPECKNTKPIANGTNGPMTLPNVEGKTCPVCGSPMRVRVSRYGPFLSCSRYPDCKHIERIEQSTGVSCASCKKGMIVVKRARRGGRTFYACNRYPECKFSLWQRPTGALCPKCSSLVVFAKEGTTRCSNKTCKFFKEDIPAQAPVASPT